MPIQIPAFTYKSRIVKYISLNPIPLGRLGVLCPPPPVTDSTSSFHILIKFVKDMEQSGQISCQRNFFPIFVKFNDMQFWSNNYIIWKCRKKLPFDNWHCLWLTLNFEKMFFSFYDVMHCSKNANNNYGQFPFYNFVWEI